MQAQTLEVQDALGSPVIALENGRDGDGGGGRSAGDNDDCGVGGDDREWKLDSKSEFSQHLTLGTVASCLLAKAVGGKS